MRQRHAVVAERPVNTAGQVLFASMIGTTIEFFDFYIYATAAVLVFPRLFFPAADPASAVLASLATFAIAFVARPIGSALFCPFRPRAGPPAAPGRGPGERGPRVARDVRDRLRRPPDRLGALRPLRRPRRPQGDARRRAADDG